MSTPHGIMDEHQDVWQWVGSAFTFAHSIGLHLDTDHAQLDEKSRKLRRRLWWSCYIREHVVAMGLGRPSRLTFYNVPMLGIDDFEIAELSEDVTAIALQCPVARDLTRQRQLATLCIEKARLCVCIRRVVSAMCASRRHGQESLAHSDSDICSKIDFCARELDSWAAVLPKEAAYTISGQGMYALEDRCLILSKATLHMIYFAAVCALHRPRALALDASSQTDRGLEGRGKAQRLVRWAASEITKINRSLKKLGLISYLDATGVANVIAAVVIHLLDAKASDDTTRAVALRGLNQCIEALRILKDTYGSAVHALQFLEAAARSAGSQPLPEVQSPTSMDGHEKMQRKHHLLEEFSPEKVITPRPGEAMAFDFISEPNLADAGDTGNFDFAITDDAYFNDAYWRTLGYELPDMSVAFQASLGPEALHRGQQDSLTSNAGVDGLSPGLDKRQAPFATEEIFRDLDF